MDRDGNLVDVSLSKARDQETAEAFFCSAVTVAETTPDKVTTAQHASYPPALDEVFCDDLEHRTSRYSNNHLEQDRRGVKGRYRLMRGFQTHPITDVVRNPGRVSSATDIGVPAVWRIGSVV